jgi:hypothetical protein
MRLASPAVIGAGLIYVPKLLLRAIEAVAMTRRDVDIVAEEAVTLRFAETARNTSVNDQTDLERPR